MTFHPKLHCDPSAAFASGPAQIVSTVQHAFVRSGFHGGAQAEVRLRSPASSPLPRDVDAMPPFSLEDLEDLDFTIPPELRGSLPEE